jgi:DHA2 family methylenomycin A resistance protein-like MFS transporter
MEAAPPDRGGIASGVVNAARQAGSVLGVALLGSLVSARTGFSAGLHAGIVVAAAAFFLAAGLAFAGVRRPAGA